MQLEVITYFFKLIPPDNFMETYEKLLEEAHSKIKPVEFSKGFERWEMPEAEIQIVGNKTILCNFMQICSYIRRDCYHFIKFLSKETASLVKIDNDRLIFNRKIKPEALKEKIKLYVAHFVICQECKKPDTELIKQDGLFFIRCLACGAKHSLGKI